MLPMVFHPTVQMIASMNLAGLLPPLCELLQIDSNTSSSMWRLSIVHNCFCSLMNLKPSSHYH